MITAVFGEGKKGTVAYGLWQYDFGQTLQIQGLKLPAAVQVHFALQLEGEVITHIGTTKNNVTTVDIPDSLLKDPVDICDERSAYLLHAWVYQTNGESGKTLYEIALPVARRAKPTDYTEEEEERLKSTLAKMTEVAESMEKEVESLKNKIDNLSKNLGEALSPSDVQSAVDKYLESNTVEGIFTPNNLVLYEEVEEGTAVTADDIIAETLAKLELRATKNQALGLYMGDILIDSVALDEFRANEIICSGLTISPAESTVYGKAKVELIATAEPIDCNQKVRWFSGDEAMATVQNGTVQMTGKSGSVSIMAVCGNYRANAKITVEQYVYTDFDWQIGLISDAVGGVYSRSGDSQNMRISSAYIATPVDTEIIMTGGDPYRYTVYYYKDGKLAAPCASWAVCNAVVTIKADEYDGFAIKVMRKSYAKWDDTYIEAFAKTISIQSA